MAITVNVHEAKTRLSELLARAERGEEVIIARAGTPIARLDLVQPAAKRVLGFLDIELADSFFDPLPEDELRRWEGHE